MEYSQIFINYLALEGSNPLIVKQTNEQLDLKILRDR